jgi:predicted anti-sigma-YlaC factor YlaD
MTEHVTAWLGAYHDGELRGRRVQQVEAHMAGCATCRAEMEKLRELSALLTESPPVPDLTSPERFVAQVGLRLPRRPERSAWHRGLEIGWQLAPLGLLGAWAMVQAVFAVAGLLLIALQMGLGGDALAWLLPGPPQGTRLTAVFGLSDIGLNDVGQIALNLLSGGGPLGWGVTLNLVSLLVIGLLYWSWLASWWVLHRRQQRF